MGALADGGEAAGVDALGDEGGDEGGPSDEPTKYKLTYMIDGEVDGDEIAMHQIAGSQAWQEKFIGKQIWDENGNVVLSVVKKVENPATQVDCVTGATLTSNGVDAMLKGCR